MTTWELEAWVRAKDIAGLVPPFVSNTLHMRVAVTSTLVILPRRDSPGEVLDHLRVNYNYISKHSMLPQHTLYNCLVLIA